MWVRDARVMWVRDAGKCGSGMPGNVCQGRRVMWVRDAR